VCVVVPVLVVVVVVGVSVVALVSVDIYEVELTYRTRKLNCHSSLQTDRAFSTDLYETKVRQLLDHVNHSCIQK